MQSATQKIILLNEVDSTNNYATRLIQKGMAKHGMAISAVSQTSGKGRFHRNWISEPGKNIILSVITDMNGVFLNERFLLSMIAALSVAQLIEDNYSLKPFVKWPNDIFVNDRKTGGILVENTIRGTLWQWAVTGFGININQENFGEYQNATSLFNESYKKSDINELTHELRSIFLHATESLKKGNKKNIIARYNQKLFKKGEKVKLQTENRVFESVIVGVTGEGKLITKDTFEREWGLDEVRIKI